MTYVGKKPADIIATAVDTTTGTFSGDLTVDTSTLVVDSANNRVGVGTSSPNEKLTISSGAISFLGEISTPSIGAGLFRPANNTLAVVTGSTERMRIDSSGNLLVGSTTSPSTARLEVRKDTNASDTLQVSAQLSTAGQYHDLALGISNAYAVGMRRHITTSTPSFLNPRLDFFVQNNNTYLPADRDVKMTILNNGNVGINTSSPDVPLEISVEGSSITNVLKLTTTGSGTVPALQFEGDASGTQHIVGRIRGQQDDANDGGLVFETESSGTVAERMRITSAGNVMIGTTSHDGNGMKLQVEHSSSATDGRVQAHGFSCRDNFGSVSNLGNGIASTASNTLVFATNSTERMRINSSGTLLWASTVDPNSSNSGISFNNATHPAINISGGSDTNFRHRIVFHNGNGVVGIISTSGSSTAYATSSDYRLKENVVEMTDATTRLKQLQPKRFNFIADADTTVDGFLAHEVQSVVPEAITGTHNEVDDDGNPVYQGIDQSKLVPLLVKTIQELEARIVALENA